MARPISVPDGGAGGATAPPGRNSISLGGKALMSEGKPDGYPHEPATHHNQEENT